MRTVGSEFGIRTGQLQAISLNSEFQVNIFTYKYRYDHKGHLLDILCQSPVVIFSSLYRRTILLLLHSYKSRLYSRQNSYRDTVT